MPWHGCVRLLAAGTALAKLASNAEPPDAAPCTDAAVCWRNSRMRDVRTDSVTKDSDHETTIPSVAGVALASISQEGDLPPRDDPMKEDPSTPNSVSQKSPLHSLRLMDKLQVEFSLNGEFAHVTGEIVLEDWRERYGSGKVCHLPCQTKLRYKNGSFPGDGELVERAINVDGIGLLTPAGLNGDPYAGHTVAHVTLYGSFVSEAPPRRQIWRTDDRWTAVTLHKGARKTVLGCRIHGKDDTPVDGIGVRLAEITPGGIFDKAGLRQGDVIISLDGASLTDPTDAAARLRAAEGDLKLAVRSTAKVPIWVDDHRPHGGDVTDGSAKDSSA